MNTPAHTLQAQLRIPAAHPAFAGHFPGNPIVPGVVLLDHVLQAIQAHRNCRLLSIASVKFLQPVLPDDVVDLEIRISPVAAAEHRAHFRGLRAATAVIEGVFTLQDNEAAS
ncbi:3-hydroxymyristoyl/3-hydroxydecanoyl-(acyl carrier protein) dehydratase [Povalibacter uvarum]|uniref:3-hydroxymyristoyl/3-hydroxydecanoyl-(Acyl carrier protein) dehydratase n=1 Tax=Povalibacter uvarum TaxID=732238 RepID=A0A841HLC2_9GAMM|nr:beta-hydroxyacyl-ACP dehydratase [Povalibacter uvarum]MBB6093384.1 3-hydroxymyristoyl/3-hydroxydecanoyl-(acyl carrier protein) dehydratase [Povalibacter uvarum]